MVEFLEEVKGAEFVFEKGKRYVSKKCKRYISKNDIVDVILVRQPNSPKKKIGGQDFLKIKKMSYLRLLRKKKCLLPKRKKNTSVFSIKIYADILNHIYELLRTKGERIYE